MNGEFLKNPEVINQPVILSSGKGGMRLISEQANAIADFSDLRYNLPNFEIINNPENVERPTLILSSAEDIFKTVTKDNGALEITYGDRRLAGGLEDKYLRRDISSLITTVLERSRQEEGQYMVHASAINYNGRGAVFFGPTHSGKTTLASFLAFRHGASIVATEHALLGQTGIEGGTSILGVQSDLKRYLPELPVENAAQTDWDKGNRRSIELRDTDKYQKSSSLNLLVYPQIVFDAVGSETYDWSPRKSQLNLGSWMRELLDGSETLLHGGNSQMQSLDTFELSQKRMGFVNHLLEEGQTVLFMKGAPDAISEEVIKRLTD